jgi:hypothetical protein
MLRVIKKTRVYEDIVAQLKELIVEGKSSQGTNCLQSANFRRRSR